MARGKRQTFPLMIVRGCLIDGEKYKPTDKAEVTAGEAAILIGSGKACDPKNKDGVALAKANLAAIEAARARAAEDAEAAELARMTPAKLQAMIDGGVAAAMAAQAPPAPA